MSENDFGYLDVSFASDLPVEKVSTLEEKVKILEARMKEINKIYLPLLDRLSEQPEKDFIKWPGRKEGLNQYRTKLIQLTSIS